MTTTAATHTKLEHALACDGAPVSMLVHCPSKPKGWLVWAHGGSWQQGSASQWAPVTTAIAARSGWAIASVNYRLAPAHRFPAAVFDLLIALDWADGKADEAPVVVGGDSAGGTIAALAALARRDFGKPVPPQLLAYPPFDPSCTRLSYTGTPSAFPNSARLRAAWLQWLGPDDSSTSALPTTPLQAKTLVGLSPVSLVAGADDPVRDDVTAYADQLRAADVPVSLTLIPAVGHADLFMPRSRALAAVVAALRDPQLSAPPASRPSDRTA